MLTVMFGIFAVVTLGAALMVVLSRNLLHSALWLVLAFFGIAGLFVLLQAEFLAVVQVLVYVGAIATLIIFALMLSRNFLDPKEARFNNQWGLVVGFAALLLVGLLTVVSRAGWIIKPAEVPADVIPQLGTAFVGAYAVPFEVASVLLVVAMIGAIIIARENE
jgi:NADH-quinone oxidoreductase subunit J